MKNVIFKGHGMFISTDNNKYFINYDAGGIVTKDVKCEISEEEAIKAQRSGQDAYEIMLLTQHRGQINNTLDKVIDAMNKYKYGEVAPLSPQVLIKVKTELEEKIKVMDPKIYMPGYPRFILDWPDDDGLLEALLNTAYQYGEIRKS